MTLRFFGNHDKNKADNNLGNLNDDDDGHCVVRCFKIAASDASGECASIYTM